MDGFRWPWPTRSAAFAFLGYEVVRSVQDTVVSLAGGRGAAAVVAIVNNFSQGLDDPNAWGIVYWDLWFIAVAILLCVATIVAITVGSIIIGSLGSGEDTLTWDDASSIEYEDIRDEFGMVIGWVYHGSIILIGERGSMGVGEPYGNGLRVKRNGRNVGMIWRDSHGHIRFEK